MLDFEILGPVSSDYQFMVNFWMKVIKITTLFFSPFSCVFSIFEFRLGIGRVTLNQINLFRSLLVLTQFR